VIILSHFLAMSFSNKSLYSHNSLFVFVLVSPDEKPSDTMVKKLLEDVEKYTLASHLIWGLWGIISVISTILFYHTCIFWTIYRLDFHFVKLYRNMWMKSTLTTWSMQDKGSSSIG